MARAIDRMPLVMIRSASSSSGSSCIPVADLHEVCRPLETVLGVLGLLTRERLRLPHVELQLGGVGGREGH